ncbi:MAG: biotin attachment protein [Firmicutes bacterium]|nr:biotin attachment protein [Bacillota bacterium]
MKETKNITMPKLSPSMEEAVLVAWAKEPQEQVQAGDVLFEVETDKVVCEIEATEDGVLERLCFEEGDPIKPGQTVAVLRA